MTNRDSFLPEPHPGIDTHHIPAVPVEVVEAIRFWGATLDDAEKNRKATQNRLRSLGDDEWGAGMPDIHPLMGLMNMELEHAQESEKRAEKHLKASFKMHPLYEAVAIKGRKPRGVDWKGVARYVVAVGGDPYWHDLEERPRKLSELWSYSGLHVVDGVAPKRKRGQTANWSSPARMRAWNIAKAIEQAGGPYKEHVYFPEKEEAQTAVHVAQCQNTIRPVAGQPKGSNGCGTQANPELGAPGTPLRPGHIQARAIRMTAKEVVRDLWSYMRDVHES